MKFSEFLNEDGLELNNKLDEEFKSKSKAAMELRAEASRRNDGSVREFQVLAGHLANYVQTGNPKVIADAAKMLNFMNDEARDKAIEIIMKHDKAMAKSIMRKAGLHESEDVQEVEEVNEASDKAFNALFTMVNDVKEKWRDIKNAAANSGVKTKDLTDIDDDVFECISSIKKSLDKMQLLIKRSK